MIKRPVLRYHGGKFRLAPWVMTFFPKHVCYVEPFGGAAGVLLQKPRAYAEVYNDLDGDVVNFFRVIRDPIERARRLCIRAQMGFGSAGATKGVTGFRIDTKRAYGTAQHDWMKYPAGIAVAGERLSGVLIENRPAIDVMKQHDAPDTLHFVDPPYVMSTRDARARTGGAYRHEMTDDDHVQLLHVLQSLQGMVVLSGYYTEIYDQLLPGWNRHETAARISAGRGTRLKTECIWLNPACAAALQIGNRQQEIFA